MSSPSILPEFQRCSSPLLEGVLRDRSAVDSAFVEEQVKVFPSIFFDMPQSRFFDACREAGLVDDQGKWVYRSETPLPSLNKDQIQSIFNSLKKTLRLKSKGLGELPEKKREPLRKVLANVKAYFESRDQECPIVYNEKTEEVSFRVNVRLQGLLAELMDRSPVEVESIQLIGGSLPSILGVSYYQRAFKNLRKEGLNGLLSDRTFANIEIPPVDLDVRFNVPNATGEDLNALSRISLEYIVKQISADEKIKGALCFIVKELGLTNAAQVRPVMGGAPVQFDLISFGNLGEEVDVMFCQHIPVTKLFNCHGLSVNVDSLIKKSSLKEYKGSLELEYTNGWQALFDAVMGHLDVEDSTTNYHQGWSKFISFVTRGKSCLNPDLKRCLTTQSQVSAKDILRAFPFADDPYACIPLIINHLVMTDQESTDMPLEELFNAWGISFSGEGESVFHRISREIVSSARDAGLTCGELITILQVVAYQQISLKQDSGIGSIFCRVENTLGKPVMAVDIPYLKWRLSYRVPLITDGVFDRFIALMNTPKKQCFERFFEIIASQPSLKSDVEKGSLNQLFVESEKFIEPLSLLGSCGVVLSFLLQKPEPLGTYTRNFLLAVAEPISEVMKRKLVEVYFQQTVSQDITGKGFFFNGFGKSTKDELYFILVKDLLQSRDETFIQLAMAIWADSKEYILSEEVKRFAINTMHPLGVRKKKISICLDVLENCLTVKDYEMKVDLVGKLSKGFDHNNFDDRSRKKVIAFVYELVEGATTRILQKHKESLSDIVHWVALVSINSSIDGAFINLISKAKEKRLISKPLPNLERGLYEFLSMTLGDDTVDILKVVKLFEDGKRSGLFAVEKIPEEYFEMLMTIAERCYEKDHVLQFESFIGYLQGKLLSESLNIRRAALVLKYLEGVLPDVDAEGLKTMVTGKYSAFLSGEKKRDYRYQILVRSIDKNFALGSEIALEMLSESTSLEWQQKALALYLDQLNRAVVGQANPLITESLKILRHKNCGGVLSSNERLESLLKCLKLTDSKNSEQRLSLVVEALKDVGDDQLEVLEEPVKEAFRAIQNQRGAKTKGQQEFIEALKAHYPRFISFYHRNNQPEALLTFIKNSAIIGVGEPNDEQTFLIIVEALVSVKNSQFLYSFYVYLINNFKLLIDNIDNKNCFDIFCVMGDRFVPNEPEKVLQWISLCMPYETVADGVVDKWFEWIDVIVQKDRKFTETKLVDFLRKNKVLLSLATADFYRALFDVCVESKNYQDALFVLRKGSLESLSNDLIKKMISDSSAPLSLIVELIIEFSIDDLELFSVVGNLILKKNPERISDVFVKLFLELTTKTSSINCKHFILIRELIKKYSLKVAREIFCDEVLFKTFTSHMPTAAEEIATFYAFSTVVLKSLASENDQKAIIDRVIEVRNGMPWREEGLAAAYFDHEALFINSICDLNGDDLFKVAYIQFAFFGGMYLKHSQKNEAVERKSIQLLKALIARYKKLKDTDVIEWASLRLSSYIGDNIEWIKSYPLEAYSIFQAFEGIRDPRILERLISWVKPIIKISLTSVKKKEMVKVLINHIHEIVKVCNIDLVMSFIQEPEIPPLFTKEEQSKLMGEFLNRLLTLPSILDSLQRTNAVVNRFERFILFRKLLKPNSEEYSRITEKALSLLVSTCQWPVIYRCYQMLIDNISEIITPICDGISKEEWLSNPEKILLDIGKKASSWSETRKRYPVFSLFFEQSYHTNNHFYSLLLDAEFKSDSERREVYQYLEESISIMNNSYELEEKTVSSLIYKYALAGYKIYNQSELSDHQRKGRVLFQQAEENGRFLKDPRKRYFCYLMLFNKDLAEPKVKIGEKRKICNEIIKMSMENGHPSVISQMLNMFNHMHDSLYPENGSETLAIYKKMLAAVKKRPYDLVTTLIQAEQSVSKVISMAGLGNLLDHMPMGGYEEVGVSLVPREYPLFRVIGDMLIVENGTAFSNGRDVKLRALESEVIASYIEVLMDLYMTTEPPEGSDYVSNIGPYILVKLETSIFNHFGEEEYLKYFTLLEKYVPLAFKVFNDNRVDHKEMLLAKMWDLINSCNENYCSNKEIVEKKFWVSAHWIIFRAGLQPANLSCILPRALP
jgi:hypothetical protein